MKSTILFLVLSSIFTLNAQTTYVPDDNFEQRLIDLGYDDVLDDYVLTANIIGVTDLDIQYQSIADVTGLEDFASLQYFNCNTNQISILNFHPNVNLGDLVCRNNPLTELDLSQHTNLNNFNCTSTALTNLDLSQNINLRYLSFSSTPLTEIDLSNNPNLLEVFAPNSSFEFVDLRNGNNEEIGEINFLNNPNLPYIYVDNCGYSIANWTNIDPLTKFVEMEGQTGCLTYIPDDNFEQALIDLGYDDVLDDYVLTANIYGLTTLVIENKSISDATGLEDFASLTNFQCGDNQISNLNFHQDVNLTLFSCQNNPLSELDLSEHTNLNEFDCTNTNITNIDFSRNFNLQYLYCGSTPMITLDLSSNFFLRIIEAPNSSFEYINLRNWNNVNMEEVNFLNNPNLPYIYVDNCYYSTINWNNIDPSTIFVENEGEIECERLTVEDFTAELNFSFYPNPVKDVLVLRNIQNIEIQKIEILDVYGKIIKTFTSGFNTMDFNNLQTGFYFLTVLSEYGIVTKKIIKS